MKKRVAILQSNYIPWKGYFDLINLVDEFILYDDMQFTRRDWRNRNKIKTPDGPLWLTIPVETKGRFLQPIRETVVSDPDWGRKHWKTIRTFYSRAPHFKTFADLFESLYLSTTEKFLSRINYTFLTGICKLLNIQTRISWSMDYRIIEGKTERLVDLCRQAGATDYLSGPAARDYVVPELFAEAGIGLHWMDYSGYRPYPQLFPPFEHGVSILDLLFNTGHDARSYLKSSEP